MNLALQSPGRSVRRFGGTFLALLGSLALAGCSGSGGESGPGSSFAVLDLSVTQGEQNWRINRAIDIRFNEDVDFGSVGLNTIQIADLAGRPATGSFVQPLGLDGLPDPRTVRFQPACPTQADNSDAGLLPGGILYRISVLGSDNGALTVRSTAGDPLQSGRSVSFRTPTSTLSNDLFVDTVAGPPAARLRGQAGVALDEADATYLELGGDPENRVYFEFNAATQAGTLPAGFEVPLNKYGEIDTRVAVLVFLDQPVDPAASNFSSQRVSLEYLDPSQPTWTQVPTRAALDANCTETGAVLRLEPQGLLPQGAPVRVRLGQGFSDLTGDGLDAPRVSFARMTTRVANHPMTADPTRDADDLLESFLIGGAALDSLEDTEAQLAVPPADWGDGVLRASFAFDGTGGTGGAFDWEVATNVTIMLDTTSTQIQGPSGTQPVIGGRFDVRNFFLPANSTIIFQGPNPARIFATGQVRIAGNLIAQGSTSPGVGTLNTTNFPEVGGNGQAGGGIGGVASFLTSQSTPRGGSGGGAFGRAGLGGQGGESCFSADSSVTSRRGAGGGGGRLGADVIYQYLEPTLNESFPVFCQTLPGMDAEGGFGGGGPGTSAATGIGRALGGAPSPTPFVDGDAENNFLGAMLVDPGEPTERLVLGELDRLWAGAGGGAGGDAILSAVFPPPVFDPAGDEKGAGGGGGGGGVSIFAIGPILVEESGTISVAGGGGGGGENTGSINRIGGGSGGGSGGHLVLSSANFISFAGFTDSAGDYYNDEPVTQNFRHDGRPINALGGQGGAGRSDKGGHTQMGPSPWQCDSIPLERLDVTVVDSMGMERDIEVPPLGTSQCYDVTSNLRLTDINDELGPLLGAGGDGGPGIIQLHVDDPALNLRFPGLQTGDADTGFSPAYGEGLDVTKVMTPPPLGWNGLNDADQMVPFFGAQSMAQSRWIPLGLARVQPDPANPGEFLADDQVTFAFEGTDPMTGQLSTNPDGTIQTLTPIVGPDPLGSVDTMPPFVMPGSGGLTMVFDSSTAPDLYLRSAALLRGAVVRLSAGAGSADFQIEESLHDEVSSRFEVTVSSAGASLADFIASAGAPVSASLVPHYFRAETGSFADVLPTQSSISIVFDATRADSSGNPNPDLAYSVSLDGMGEPRGFAADASLLNSATWDFVRFRVEFNLNTTGSGVDLSTPRPALRFLRLPFEY